ncbi:MAG: CRISPR system precrRNA processing endoribonuclease RAMP protein Cas6 [Anaerolineae bacterium]
MSEFTAHHLRFVLKAETLLELPAHKGSALRGALFGALKAHYCPAPSAPDPLHSTLCPVCWLMAREEPQAERGKDVPRPYTLKPPLRPWTRLEPGEEFTFGITLFAQAIGLFPYLILAVPEMGRIGIGHRIPENGYRRGQFSLQRAETVNLLTGETKTIFQAGNSNVRAPERPITPARVQDAADYLASQLRANGGILTMTFLTPTRIIYSERLVHRPFFSPLFHRLLERLEALMTTYGGEAFPYVKEELLPLADRVRLVEDGTHWVEVKSYSRRQDRTTPVSGFVGRATFQAAAWEPLLPPLIWGQVTHVGKNAVKGDGWYRLDVAT